MSTSAPVLRAAFRFTSAVLVAAALATVPAFAQADDSHPAHIHNGTCNDLGDVVFPLADVAGGTMGTPLAEMAATPAAQIASTPSAAGELVARGATAVAATLDDLLAAPHAINIHESADAIGTYIACGEISGEPTDGALAVELAELNDSGYTGEATLESADGETTVDIRLYAKTDRATGGTPEAGPAQPAQDVLAVDIRNFLYAPDPVTVPVGGSVTWTNSDPVPHTATARDRDVLQTGTIGTGESTTVTFDTAGTYDYFCEFHSGMKGTLVVE